jgi:hypothetical protein
MKENKITPNRYKPNYKVGKKRESMPQKKRLANTMLTSADRRVSKTTNNPLTYYIDLANSQPW